MMIFTTLSHSFSDLQSALNSFDHVSVPPLFNNTAVLVGRMILEINSTTPTVQVINNNPWGTVA